MEIKVGDLVIHIFKERVGLVYKLADDPLARKNDSFDVLWLDGSVSYSVWDYDLLPANESRCANQ